MNHILRTLPTLLCIIYCCLYNIHVSAEISDTGPYIEKTSVKSSVQISGEVNTSDAVGEIPVVSGTDPNGAKTYQVPIAIPSGINGFQPDLSLIYNSLQGFSPIGTGWNLSGISGITRGGKNIYFDGETKGVVMDNSDSFVLDGVRLIKKQSDAGYILYESERGNIKVKGYADGNSMKYFEVFYPNGNRGVFGYPDWNGNRITYPVTSLSDPRGNTVSFGYLHENNYDYIKNISYNDVSILFTYTANPIPNVYYRHGVKVDCRKSMEYIYIRNNGTTEGRYCLSHSYYNNSFLLEKISYFSDSQSLNPLRFFYGDGSSTDSYAQRTIRSLGGYKMDDINNRVDIRAVRGKIDYRSGADAILAFPDKSPYSLMAKNEGFENQYNGTEKIYRYYDLNKEEAQSDSEMTTGSGFIDILCSDIEGKQEENVIRINNYPNNDNDRIHFDVYKPDETGGLHFSYTRIFEFKTLIYTKYHSVQPKLYYSGDFNGDGKMEILVVSVHQPLGSSHESKCYIFDITTGNILYQSHLFPFHIDFSNGSYSELKESGNNSDRIFVIDYDGDGKSDLCHVGENGMTVYSFKTANTGLTAEQIAVNSDIRRSTLADRYFLPGDINGDGLTDFILSPLKVSPYGSTWRIYYSKGDGCFDIVESKSGPLISPNQVPKFILHDINGDGKSDLIGKLRDRFTTYLINGNTFYQKAVTELKSSLSLIVPADHNSRNEHARLMSVFNGNVTLYSFLRNIRRDVLMTGMSNSLGVIERNEYGYINEQGVEDGYYTQGSDAVYPYIDILEPLSVVTHTETSHDDVIFSSRDFRYDNGVFHRHGLGFCGFGKVTATDGYGRVYTEEYEPDRFGLPKRSTSPSMDINYAYSTDVSPDKIIKALLTEKEESDLLKGTSSATTYSYNGYGNPLEENTVTSDNISVKTVYEYIDNTDIDDPETGYCLGLVTSRTSTYTRGGPVYTEQEHIPAYTKGLAAGKNVYKNGNRVEHIDYAYDSYGNLTSESVIHYDSPDILNTTYSYDSNGHLLKKTDPMGLCSQYTYDSRGLAVTSTDCRGNVTTHEYDPFGRETVTLLPDGTVHTITYAWEATDNGGIYSVTETETGKPTVKKYYDAFNREVRVEQTRFDGSTIKTDKGYDCKGNLIFESQPYKSQYNLSTVNDYDPYDRLITTTNTANKRTWYHYSGTSVTEDDGIRSATRDYDSAGNLLSVSDTEGVINFTLGADGQKESVSIDDGSGPDNINTIYSYDKYRRMTSVNDPSQGETLTAYDEAGNIASRTDANGKTTTYEYDIYGRLTKKSFPEFETTYTYNEYGDLVSQNSTNGTFRNFTYDNLGRLVSEKEGASAGTWLQKDYTYENGNTATITYASNHGKLATETYSYTDGHLTSVMLDDGQVIYELQDENDFGKPVRVVTGGIIRDYEYDQYGFPTKRYAESEEQIYQIETYSFDPYTSNLYYRDDYNIAYNEYEYDGQDRLIYADGVTVNYSDNGNIADKSDVGTYEYGIPGKPYAVSGIITDNIGDFPQNEQNVTYTSFSRPSEISENGFTAKFKYNADGERVNMYIEKGRRDCLSRDYLGGCYECDHVGAYAANYIEKLYLMGDYYSAPSVLIKGLLPSFVVNDSVPILEGDSLILGIDDPIRPIRPLGIEDATITPNEYFSSGKTRVQGVHQILRDYLGSITHVIQPDGTEIECLSYDAWGRVRLPEENGRYLTGTDPPTYLGRGYTGHEHLPMFGLVNMNARLYDPMLGRFLSPDPYVAFEDWLQSYNRYSYANNNPLYYIDENGEFAWVPFLVGAVIGGTLNLVSKASSGQLHSFGDGLAAFGIGALAGGASAYFGGYAFTALGGAAGGAGGFVAGAAGCATGAAVSMPIQSFGNTAYFNDPFMKIDDYFIGIASAAVLGGVTNGITAKVNGYDFWTGSKKLSPITIAFSSSVNNPHYVEDRSYTLYKGVEYDPINENYVERYIGITKRDPYIRFAEHLRSGTERANLEYNVFKINLTRSEARMWEQYYISKYGLKINGGQLLNIRNEIDPKYWINYNLLRP